MSTSARDKKGPFVLRTSGGSAKNSDQTVRIQRVEQKQIESSLSHLDSKESLSASSSSPVK